MEKRLTAKEHSRIEYTSKYPGTSDDIQDGCLQRIADALEKLTSDPVSTEKYLLRRIAALRGYITRLKK
jgi:hypothetical protein